MAYEEKTDWLPDDPINEDDVNRWEKGIKVNRIVRKPVCFFFVSHRYTTSKVNLKSSVLLLLR
jgi:hypothetical protein